MKKVILFAIIAFSISRVSYAQDILNLRMDCNQLNLRGNVAMLDEDLLVRKDYFREDWPSRKWFRTDLRQFLQEDKGYIYTFRQNGRLASVIYTYKGVEGKRTNCSYASNGLLESFVGEGYRVQASYSGNRADINIYAETPSYSPKIDLDHADLAHTPYTKVYPFDMKCRQELSDDGLVLKSSYYYVDSMPARVCTYSYSHRGQVVSERLVDYAADPDGSNVTVTSYTYDNNDCLVMKKVRGVAYDETFTYINNEQGDCEELTIVRPYGTVVYTYQYEYDNEGNWIMRLCFKDGVFDNAVLRNINYFKTSGKPAKSTSEPAAYEDDNANAPAQSVASDNEKNGFFAKLFKSKGEKADKPKKTKSEKADKPKKAKDENVDKPKKAKGENADKPKKAKDENVDKPKKAKGENADKPKKAKGEKADKPKKTKGEKADKPKKAKGEKADKPKKVKKSKDKSITTTDIANEGNKKKSKK